MPTDGLSPRRVFSLEDQLEFSELSGDSNPIHVDGVAARRLLAGGVVVHGIHSLLWGLDTWLATVSQPVALGKLVVTFLKPILVGDDVRFQLVSEKPGGVKFKLFKEETPVVTVDVQWQPAETAVAAGLPQSAPGAVVCRERTIEEMAGAAGSVGLYLNEGDLQRRFPTLGSRLPRMQISTLLATSRLVGMECPGLHSLFSSLRLQFGVESTAGDEMQYSVTEFDDRFKMATIQVAAPRTSGEIKAFFRPAPQRQVTFDEVRAGLPTDEFRGQRAVIIGGSRGVGEVTAKILAAGGAEVRISYFQGSAEADAVVREIQAGGGVAASFPFNVAGNANDLVRHIPATWLPTHLYYFATPFVFGGNAGVFSQALFEKFCRYYVTGFLSTVNQIKAIPHALQGVFYPSSVAVDELPDSMVEYVLAKVAGETLCSILGAARGAPVYFKPRLPRLATDQTVSLYPVENEDPLPAILALLRTFHAAAATAGKNRGQD